MIRPGKNPDGAAIPTSVDSALEVTHQPFALELVDVERDPDVEAVPGGDPVGKDLPLCNAELRGQMVQSRKAVGEIVATNPVDARIEATDRQAVDQHPICERRDHVVAQVEVGQTTRQALGQLGNRILWKLSHAGARSAPEGVCAAITASVVNMSAATDAAFCSATRTTLVGSMIPAAIRSS